MVDDTTTAGQGTANDAMIVTDGDVSALDDALLAEPEEAPPDTEPEDAETIAAAAAAAEAEAAAAARTAQVEADLVVARANVDANQAKVFRQEAHLEGAKQGLADAEAVVAALEGEL